MSTWPGIGADGMHLVMAGPDLDPDQGHGELREDMGMGPAGDSE